MARRTIVHVKRTPSGVDAVIKTYSESGVELETRCSGARRVRIEANSLELPSGLDPRWTTIVLEGSPEVVCKPPLLLIRVVCDGGGGSTRGAEQE